MLSDNAEQNKRSVKERAQEFLVQGDSNYAHVCQQEEYTHKHTGYKHRNQTLREDIGVSRIIQSEEEMKRQEDAMRRHEQLNSIKQADEELAKQIERKERAAMEAKLAMDVESEQLARQLQSSFLSERDSQCNPEQLLDDDAFLAEATVTEDEQLARRLHAQELAERQAALVRQNSDAALAIELQRTEARRHLYRPPQPQLQRRATSDRAAPLNPAEPRSPAHAPVPAPGAPPLANHRPAATRNFSLPDASPAPRPAASHLASHNQYAVIGHHQPARQVPATPDGDQYVQLPGAPDRERPRGDERAALGRSESATSGGEGGQRGTAAAGAAAARGGATEPAEPRSARRRAAEPHDPAYASPAAARPAVHDDCRHH